MKEMLKKFAKELVAIAEELYEMLDDMFVELLQSRKEKNESN